MLKQVPWEKVDVEVLMIELAHAGKVVNVYNDDYDVHDGDDDNS